MLAKLSATNMVAADAMYHAKCLSSLYNNVCTLELKERSEDKYSLSTHGLAFASLVSYSEDFRDSENAPVFKLADLVKLYISKLNYL